MRIEFYYVAIMFILGCSSPESIPKTQILPPIAKKENPRVLSGAYKASRVGFSSYLRKTIHSLVSSATEKPVTIELHGRGRAVRVSVTGDLTKLQTMSIGVALCNILVMYYDDVCVSVNHGVFRPSGSKPDDGAVGYRKRL